MFKTRRTTDKFSPKAKCQFNVSSLNYGSNNEDIVANYYLQYQERHGHPGIKLFSCGLNKYCWLGASPGRVVFDPTSPPLYGGGLEIKCIELESGKGMTPLQTYQVKREPQFGKKKSFCLFKNCDILQLDPNHLYHHLFFSKSRMPQLEIAKTRMRNRVTRLKIYHTRMSVACSGRGGARKKLQCANDN